MSFVQQMSVKLLRWDLQAIKLLRVIIKKKKNLLM